MKWEDGIHEHHENATIYTTHMHAAALLFDAPTLPARLFVP